MNTILFTCSAHGQQEVDNVSVGIIPSIPVRVTLKCGCCFVWMKDLTWKQQVETNGLQELARKEIGPGGQAIA